MNEKQVAALVNAARDIVEAFEKHQAGVDVEALQLPLDDLLDIDSLRDALKAFPK